MSEITKLSLWNDPGFTDGSVEVPQYSGIDTLPAPTLTLDNTEIVPSKARFFSELKLKIPYNDALNFSYLKMTVKYNDDNVCFYYGFIDSVTLGSDNLDFPLVNIAFHIDLWRTYLKQAVFGSGLVKRRPRGLQDPIQALTPRYKKVSDRAFNLIPETMVGGGAYWAIINYCYESADHTTSEGRVIVVPVAKDPSVIYYMKMDANGTVYQVPKLEDWLLSKFDEILGLAPSSISSVFLSPVPPLKLYSGTGALNDPFIVVGATPTPTPTVRTYSGVNQPKAYDINNNGYIVVSDGRTIRPENDWDSAIIYAISGDYQHVPYAYINLRGYIKVNGSVVLSTDGDNVRTLGAMPIDDYMRAVLGEPAFNALQNGDTITFTNAYGLYSSGSLDMYYHRDHIPYSDNWNVYYDWIIDVSGALPSNQVFTFNNGSFGSGWVVVNGEFSLTSVTLTTYSEATTSAEYGFIEGVDEDENPRYGALYTKTNRFAEYSASLGSTIRTTDTEQFIVTDLDGSIVASVPWGFELRDYTFRCVISATSGYVQFRFDNLNSSAEGLQFTIPLPTLDITSNSWSAYLYSGRRDYDIEQRKIARDQAMVEGVIKSVTGGYQSGLIGGLKEDMSLAGAGLVGAIGAGAGVAGSAIGYKLSEYYGDKLQGMSDQLQSKQLDSITTGGNGPDWLYYGRPYQIRSMVPDDYSLARFNKDVSLNGISVSEPVEDCTALIRESGPLMIENLVVRGNIPVEAKQYIKDKLNNGVRLK